MTAVSIDAKRAIENTRSNPARRWGGRIKTSPNAAAKRLTAGEILSIGHEPRFKLKRGSSVFTIGSCFARHIEEKLRSAGVDVPTTRFSGPPDVFRNKEFTGPVSAVLNKFTIHSINNELRRVLERWVPKNRGFIGDGNDLWFDPQATASGSLNWDTVNAMRDAIEATTASIRTADATFITLGLTESWYDSETGLYLNGLLPGRLLQRYPGRFRFVNHTYPELLLETRQTIEMIQKHGKPGTKIVITVSPVPLNTTFSNQDIIVANTYSKSVLRSVAQDVRMMDDVDYFPSYEMVVYSPRELAWEDDQRHVSPAAVKAVTDRFVQLYFE